MTERPTARREAGQPNTNRDSDRETRTEMTTVTTNTLTALEASERLEDAARRWATNPDADTDDGNGVTIELTVSNSPVIVEMTPHADDDDIVTVTVTGDDEAAVWAVTEAMTTGVIETPEERMTRMTRQAMTDQQAEDEGSDAPRRTTTTRWTANRQQWAKDHVVMATVDWADLPASDSMKTALTSLISQLIFEMTGEWELGIAMTITADDMLVIAAHTQD